MKKSKFDKKLSLNKETISSLNNEAMNNVRGGTERTQVNSWGPTITRPCYLCRFTEKCI
jgi:natural product precursor